MFCTFRFIKIYLYIDVAGCSVSLSIAVELMTRVLNNSLVVSAETVGDL